MIRVAEQMEEQYSSPFPLTDLQRAYFYGRKGNTKELPIYLYTQLECSDYDAKRFEMAVRKTVYACEALRTVILPDGTQKIAKPNKQLAFSVPYQNIAALPAEEKEEQINQTIQKMCRLELPLGTYPMMEIAVTKVSENQTILHIYVDGIVCDAWSNNRMIAMLDQFYSDPSRAPQEGDSFEQYIHTIQNRRSSKAVQQNLLYWKEKVKQFPSPPLLPMHEHFEKQPHDQPIEQKFLITSKQKQKIVSFAEIHAVSVFAVLFTLFCRSLSMYSEKTDFLVNVPLMYHVEENKNVCGECADFLLFPYRRKKGETLQEEIMRIQREWTEMQQHQPIFGNQINEMYQKENNTFGQISAPVVFTDLMNLPVYALSSLQKTNLNTHTSQIWLDCVIFPFEDGFMVNLDSSEKILQSGIPERIQSQFEIALSLLDTLDTITSLPLAARDEAIIASYNDTDFDYHMQSYAERIAATIEQFESEPAVYCEEDKYTYHDFYADVRKKIGFLHQVVAPHKRVAVLLGKGYELLAWAQAIVLGGAVYAPLDYDYPLEILLKCLENLKAEAVIADDKWYEMLRIAGYAVYPVHAAAQSEEADFVRCTGSDPFVVIHTSGSTGIPKGAELNHRSLLNCLYFSEKEFQLTHADCAIALTNHCHDMSLFDMFGMFIVGGSVAIMQQENWMDPYIWRDLILEHHVTIWNTVPPIMVAFLDLLEEEAEEVIQKLRIIIHGGEYFTPKEAKRLFAFHSDVLMYNVGGPTEATIWSIYHRVSEEDMENDEIPYGRPISNQKYMLFNDYLEAVPVGIKAIMYISGAGVVSGYVDNREPEKFITDANGVLWYNSGDVGQLREDGVMLLCGRKDNQIKKNGKRIELDGIETILRRYEGIENAIVLIREPNTEILVFYTGTTVYEKAELKAMLAKELSDYMIPDDFIYLEILPLTHNGKINKKYLLEYYEENCLHAGEENAFQSTSEELEAFLEICQNHLPDGIIQAEDNFFQIGGNSLRAIMLITELNNTYDCDLSLGDIFTYPILGDLCDAIQHPED